MGKKSKRRGGKRDDERSPNVRNSPSDAVAEMLHAPVPKPTTNFRIIDPMGEETFFRVETTMQLDKLFNAYAVRKRVAATALEFLYDGEIVGGHQSAADIGIEDGEYLDVKHSSSSETFQFCFKTRESVVTDDADGENFDEYMGLILEDKSTARDGRALSHAMKRWPRIRKYWPRIRRRICWGCGKQYDLSEPRLWVCGACGEARYCDEACQREHWPAHKRECLHAWTEKVEQRLSQGVSREEVQQELDDWYQNG